LDQVLQLLLQIFQLLYRIFVVRLILLLQPYLPKDVMDKIEEYQRKFMP